MRRHCIHGGDMVFSPVGMDVFEIVRKGLDDPGFLPQINNAEQNRANPIMFTFVNAVGWKTALLHQFFLTAEMMINMVAKLRNCAIKFLVE